MDWLIRCSVSPSEYATGNAMGRYGTASCLVGDGGVIMLGSPGEGFQGPAKLGEVTQLQCITITGLVAHRERAQAAGVGVSEISVRAGRAHSYAVDDPEGHRWYFSEPL